MLLAESGRDGPVKVTINSRIKEEIRYTVDGSIPSDASPRYKRPFTVRGDVTVHAVLFKDRDHLGVVVGARFRAGESAIGTSVRATAGIATVDREDFEMSDQGLQLDGMAYTDRDYAFTEVPPQLAGLPYLMTPNDDAGSRAERLLTINLGADATLYLAHDVRMEKKPKWMNVGKTRRILLWSLWKAPLCIILFNPKNNSVFVRP